MYPGTSVHRMRRVRMTTEENFSFSPRNFINFQTLSGIAELKPAEPNLQLKVTGDGKGHITVDGKAKADFATGTHLVFRLNIDQSDIPQIVTSLRAVEQTSVFE
jgi:hypothetical protein